MGSVAGVLHGADRRGWRWLLGSHRQPPQITSHQTCSSCHAPHLGKVSIPAWEPGAVPDSLSPPPALCPGYFDSRSPVPPSAPLLCACAVSVPGWALPLQTWTKAMACSWPHASRPVLPVHPPWKSQRDPSRTRVWHATVLILTVSPCPEETPPGAGSVRAAGPLCSPTPADTRPRTELLGLVSLIWLRFTVHLLHAGTVLALEVGDCVRGKRISHGLWNQISPL